MDRPRATASQKAKAVLQVQDVQVYYGESHALQGVSLTLERGVLSVVGRNGMGKTTLIRTLLGYVTQRDGHISLFGEDVSRARPHEIARRGVAYVPEGRGIFPNLSIKENLVMGARPVAQAPLGARGWSFERIVERFPRLRERLSSLGGQLSGGEQQMLSIARALLRQPELLVLDEATEGLAPLVAADIWQVITEIRDDGIATLIVDRDFRKVLARSDQVVVLQKGLVVLTATSAELAGTTQIRELLGV